ncbi:MAG: EpsD family peptidyl-prolyl cis-trans isomerase [Burkholderiales bacterium]|nr:EpsD family peptidyl-prolyl cis-trans isomerase [Burkholderiales bacterium]MDE2076651.1 EpsD family peptidyl-prolyl cis-trans isomerase [Burkholderiales bacterium]MDE2433386.1 EpsD family peptidyl-prolyl cis-trans isomerase [Burkholderiales bacterium]
MKNKFDYVWFGLVLWCGVVSLGGCSRGDSHADQGVGSSQVLARINDKEISVHQVRTLIELQPNWTQQYGDKAPSRALDSLIEQELAAQAAHAAGLDDTPKVVQAMELAKREVLARAYQDQLAAKADMPDESEVSTYFDAHPELFAQRRQYVLQETLLKGPAAQVQALVGNLRATKSLPDLNALVRQTGLPYSVRNSSQWAEALPLDVLKQLYAIQPGQSVTVSRPDGVVVLSLVSSELAPIGLPQARAAIREVLWTLHRKEKIQKGMEALRQQARIARFDAPASSPQGGASQP